MNSKSRSAPKNRKTIPGFRVRRGDYIGAGLFVLFWIFPMLYRGLTDSHLFPRFPPTINYLYSISSLFTYSAPVWPTHHFQGTLDGKKWFTIPDDELGQMRPFGYRSRMDRIVEDYVRVAPRREGAAMRQELAEWIRRRTSERHPNVPPLIGVRCLRLLNPTGEKLGKPSGHWVNPTLETTNDQEPDLIFQVMWEAARQDVQ